MALKTPSWSSRFRSVNSSCLSFRSFSSSDSYLEIASTCGSVVVRQQIGVGYAHDGGASGLGESASIGEVPVGEVRVPVKVVIDGVILIAFVLSTKADIERRNAGEILKGSVVGSVSESVHAQVGKFCEPGRVRPRLSHARWREDGTFPTPKCFFQDL